MRRFFSAIAWLLVGGVRGHRVTEGAEDAQRRVEEDGDGIGSHVVGMGDCLLVARLTGGGGAWKMMGLFWCCVDWERFSQARW